MFLLTPTGIPIALEIVAIQGVIALQFEEVQGENPGMAEMAGMPVIAETFEILGICGTAETAGTFGITETAEVYVKPGT
jgi:hypothetical protein